MRGRGTGGALERRGAAEGGDHGVQPVTTSDPITDGVTGGVYTQNVGLFSDRKTG